MGLPQRGLNHKLQLYLSETTDTDKVFEVSVIALCALL